MTTLNFPKNFFWGSATSAHQVEGDNYNDWAVWEKSPQRIAQLKKEGKDPSGFISGRACDNYNRFEEDLDIAKQLGHNIHRFSIEWSRIEPEEGKFDEREIEHYKRLIAALRNRGIEPMVTLWHFTNPVWFSEKGGFLNKKSAEIFTRYVKYVVEKLKNEVRLWVTFNEAFTIYAALTKLNAIWPSRGKGVLGFLKMRRHLVGAHITAYHEIKKLYNPVSHNVMVGMVENNVFVPDTKNFFMTWLRRLYKQLRNFYFLKNNALHYDFIGLNYYHLSRKPKFSEKNEIISKQDIMEDMNWEIYPEGIYHVLRDLSELKKPIFITENGIADKNDLKRGKFIKDHLFWVWKAIQDGVDVRGYMYWSLMDNFEWAHGFGPRFGLVEIDYKTLERRIRPSAWEYKKICETNSLEIRN